MCFQKLGFSESLPKYLQVCLYVDEGNITVHHVKAGS